MAGLNVYDQEITDQYAIYNGDCMDVMAGLPAGSVHLSIYSPPFAGLYVYSSSERDLSNARSYDEFLEHYGFVVRELHRVTLPGRMTAVHCMDVPKSNTGKGDSLRDFPGDIIRLHEREGWSYVARYHVWKEPLTVRNRTMTKGLAHKTIVDDSTRCSVASADYLLVFRRSGENPVPVEHPHGLTEYAGERAVPADLLPYRGWKGNQIENRYSHWIWRQYASAFWDDVRLDRVLPFREARDEEDEKQRPPPAAGRHRPGSGSLVEPRRDGPDPVHGRRLGGLLGGSEWSSRPRHRAQALVLPPGDQEHALRGPSGRRRGIVAVDCGHRTAGRGAGLVRTALLRISASCAIIAP